MKIAVPVANGRLCPHFGHCSQFVIHEVDPATRRTIRREYLTPPPHEPGILPRWLHEQGVNAVIAGGMGQRAQQLFAQSGIKVIVGAPDRDPDEIVAAYLAGSLEAGENVCDH
jgi:predicted Fe-Mo cluster-binding NifX family protein